MSLLIVHSLWVPPKWTWWRNNVGSPRSTFFMRIVRVGSVFFLLANVISSIFENISLARLLKKIPSLQFFPNRVPPKFSRPKIGAFLLRNFTHWWCIIFFYVSISGYCIWRRCPWRFVPSFAMLMILVQWTPHTRIILNNVTLEFDFLFLLKMTQIYQWREMNVTVFILWFIDHIFLIFASVPSRDFPFIPSFLRCCRCIWNSHCLWHRNEFVNKIAMSHRIHPICRDVILMRFVSSSFQPWSCVSYYIIQSNED